MIKRKFFGKKLHGKFVLDSRDLYEEHLNIFHDGMELEMTLEKKHKRRTTGKPGEETNFNGYYWGVIVRIVSDAMGEIDDQVTHGILQMLFNKKGIATVDPLSKKHINIEVPKGTKELSGGEFAEYCSKIRTWASIPSDQGGLGVVIPEPHEVIFD